MVAARPLAARLRRVRCHGGCRPGPRLDEGVGLPGEGRVLLRLAQRGPEQEQLRVAWVEHGGLPLVQIARWFHDGGDWHPRRDQVSVKLYELLAVRKLLRSAHARRRPPEPGALIGERWLGRGTGRRLLAAVWTESGAVALRLGTSSVLIDRERLCHVFEALDVAIALGRAIDGSPLAKLGAGFDEPEYAAHVAAKVAIMPNKLPLINTVENQRPVGRGAAGAAPRPAQADLFGEPATTQRPKRPASSPGQRIVRAFYQALDAAGIEHPAPVWKREVAQAKRLIARAGGESVAAELVPLALADPWLTSRRMPDFGCFLRMADTLARHLAERREEQREAEQAQAEQRARQLRVWNAYRARYGRQHPDDDR